MAYDTGLAERIRDVVIDRADVFEREMFGGIAFLREGRMFVGIVRDTLMVRVGRDDHDAAIAHEHARPMDFTGRPMRGMVYVSPDGIAEDTDLE
ncbi:MAG: TfoX/Sxy family protein, partial [Sphingopyxis terrae]